MLTGSTPKKSFGQNFLKDETIVARIVEAAHIEPTDWVVEIGPGTGVLTEALAKRAERVVAIELDRDLIPKLLKQFPFSGNVSIIEGDILKTNIVSLLQEKGLGKRHYKVAANIPYYVTAPIIQSLLKLSPQPESITLMIQKEVAQRITAEPGDMSVLAMAVQYYADPELLFMVPRTAFEPMPKVESAVVKLVPKRPFDIQEDKALFRVVRAGFSARRKTLLNNLSSSLKLPKEVVAEALRSLDLRPDIRAQALDVEHWKQLQKLL